MKRLKLTPQLRIRACDRILRKLYIQLRTHMRDIQDDDEIQDKINYWEETKERIDISL